MTHGNLFIISAPSGAGKTTLLKKIMAELPGLAFSISHTTRPPRGQEKDRVDYHFVAPTSFHAMREQGAFLEWAEVHKNLYGTSKQAITDQIDAGFDVFLDIDVQGARQIRESGEKNAIFLFIAPPSREELEKRLSGRGTDSEDTIRLRLENARREMEEADHYDYVIVNDDLGKAADIIRSIIVAARCRQKRAADGKPLTLPRL